MMALENLYPSRVFYYFEQLAAIPRGSGNTKEVQDDAEKNMEIAQHLQNEANKFKF